MSHKAELAARPRVEIFFKGLQLTVDDELARRNRTPDDSPLVSPTALPLDVVCSAAAAGATAAAGHEIAASNAEDRRLAAEYLDILGANDRLSPAVRHACCTLRERLGLDR